MQPNRAELALLRGKRDPQALTQWAQAFGQGDDKKAARLGLAIATFLGQPPPGDARNDDWSDYLGQLSPNTRKAYAAVLTEFFEWAAAVHKRVVSPEEITRLDAEEYVKWLANRPFSLAAEKLKDGDQEELRALYEIIEEQGTSSLQTIIDGLSPALKSKYFGSHPTTRLENRRLLSADVRKLVTMDVVQSTPTWAVLRQSYSQAGITQWHVPLGPGGRDIAVEDVFRYQPKQYHGASRTTVAQHISALSSFWKLLAQGENVKGGEPILQYNVWEGIGKRVSRGLAHEKKQASRGQKMPSDDVVRLLKEAPSKTLVQLRNKAILYLMVFAGVRTTEILMLRRGRPERGEGKAWFDGSEPPALQLVRKGGKRMRIPYPPVALKALIEFQQMLDRHAAPTFAQSIDARDEHYISRESVAWYYRDLQLADAPLFPPLLLWGANTRADYRKSLSRVQCFRLLKQIGREIGMSEEQVSKIHPHALRHFAANAMVLGGKDIREVQAILGHSSVTTTEGYLEDPEGDVKLSGQEAILNFLDVKGDVVKPTYTGPRVAQEREVIDVVAEAVEEDKPDATSPVVTSAELEVLSSLKEDIPTHELPESPPEYDPEVVVMAMPGERPPIVETEEGLVGIDDNVFSAEELQQELAASVRDGKSPGSPAWVYEAMADPNGTHETIVFHRGGQRDLDWLLEHYPAMPKNFGVGHESYLPWFVKARGNISRGGFFKGLPPFPLFSPEQCNPETSLGEDFLARIEQAYSLLVHGDPETGRAPSPLRSVGMVRWYSFFVYHSTKFEETIAEAPEDAKTTWAPWNAVVDLGQVRAHDDAYLVQWLQDNAHTFRASIDAMKRGVSRTDDDVTASFLKSSFEGIELITEVPEWMIFDDPVAALYESDPKQWEEMILWLKNVTGQQLDEARIEDREEQAATAKVEQKTKAKVVRDLLVGVVRLVDQLSRAKHMTRERVDELREHLRVQLYWYATTAASVPRLRVSLEQIKTLGTKEFNQAMSKEYERLGIPDPNAPEFRKLRGKKRVAAMVAKLFPDIPELSNGNVFAESKLFDPKWFRIDERKHTVFIEDSEREEIIRQFGQDPELLVRRATRAMWESRDKGYEALWGILMSYFSWIVPSGQEMASSVLGIPVDDLGNEASNIQARKTWLKAWTEQMKRLAMGKELEVEEPESEEEEVPKKVKAAWELFLEESNKETDALERVVADGLDFAMSSSISGGWEDTPEDILMRMEELGRDEFWKNPGRPTRHFYRKNGKQSVAVLPGEKPQVLYHVDLFGRREGTLRPNAPPVLVSPGVVYRSQKRVFPARQLLPSPFRMIAAMELERK